METSWVRKRGNSEEYRMIVCNQVSFNLCRTILFKPSVIISCITSPLFPYIWNCPLPCRLDSALLDILKKDTEGRLGRWREQSIALGLLVSEATRKVEQDVDETDYGDIQASSVQLQVRWIGLLCDVLRFWYSLDGFSFFFLGSVPYIERSYRSLLILLRLI